MSRRIYQGTFRDGQGNVVKEGKVYVYLAGTTTLAGHTAGDTYSIVLKCRKY